MNMLKGIIGIKPDDISKDHLKDLIPDMKMKPKGDMIYLIKYVYANTDEVDGFNTYNILYNIIKQSTIVCGDRPVFFISYWPDQDLFLALKNNKFKKYNKDEIYNTKYHKKKETIKDTIEINTGYHIFVRYPMPLIDKDTAVPY